MTFADFAFTYLEWHEHEYPDSYERVEQIIMTVFARFHPMSLNGISAYDIEQWKVRRSKQATVHGKPVSKGTILKELRTLSALFNRATIWGHLEKNPVRAVTKPRETDSKPPTWYTPEQLKALYAASGHKAAWWKLMANTGMRAAEARHLRWADIRDGRVHILSREGERTKSGRWRQVPISKGAAEALERLRERSGDSEWVLPPMNPKSLSRACKTDLKRAGLPGSLHSLRHTFCSLLVQQGVALRVVQELAGHASIRTTERYSHLCPTQPTDAMRGLDL